MILFAEGQLGPLFLSFITMAWASLMVVQEILEPRVGKSVAQDHTANEPVFGIQIKFKMPSVHSVCPHLL